MNLSPALRSRQLRSAFDKLLGRKQHPTPRVNSELKVNPVNPSLSKSQEGKTGDIRTFEAKKKISARKFQFKDERLNDYFRRILERFPLGTGSHELAFAYGSGVFDQAGRPKEEKKVTDLILVVNDSVEWHRKNMRLNPKDYSLTFRLLGPKLTADFQDDFGGAKLFFNTLIPFESGLIKYGVISKQSMLADCLDWDHLYLSGRLHKPVRILTDPVRGEDIKQALRLNLQSAMHAALLLLPESFSEEQLYTTLAGLSYSGDFRMIVGEDRNKVSNIVRPNVTLFRQLYSNRLADLSDYLNAVLSRGRIDQDVSPSARHFHLSQLPKTLQWNLVVEWNHDGRYRDVEDVLRSAAYDRDSGALVGNALAKIVRGSSVSQAARGIVTAGPLKTVKYSWAKLVKMYKSLSK